MSQSKDKTSSSPVRESKLSSDSIDADEDDFSYNSKTAQLWMKISRQTLKATSRNFLGRSSSIFSLHILSNWNNAGMKVSETIWKFFQLVLTCILIDSRRSSCKLHQIHFIMLLFRPPYACLASCCNDILKNSYLIKIISSLRVLYWQEVELRVSEEDRLSYYKVPEGIWITMYAAWHCIEFLRS